MQIAIFSRFLILGGEIDIWFIYKGIYGENFQISCNLHVKLEIIDKRDGGGGTVIGSRRPIGSVSNWRYITGT